MLDESLLRCDRIEIGSAKASALRRGLGASLSGAYLLIVLWNFFYLYPVLAAKVIPYPDWHARMWFSSWI